MKHVFLRLAAILVAGSAATVRPARASEVGDASLRASLWEGVSVPGLTLGADKERFYRAILFPGGVKRNIECETYAAYVGYPIAPWLRLFATAGYAQVKPAPNADWNDGILRASAGAGLNLWRLDVPAPEFISGAVSVRAAAEYGFAAYDQNGESFRWGDTTVSATLHYEMLARQDAGRTAYPYSLDLYAGPIAQFVRGRQDIGGVERSFEEARVTGVAAGASLFLTPSLSVGAHLRFFDTFSWRAGLRLTF